MTAQIILDQINAMDSRAFMAWGVRRFSFSNENIGISEYMKPNLGYLKFKTTGMVKNKGHIIIMLMPNDTYTIIFGKVIKAKWSIKELHEDIYVDNLIPVLDEIIG